MKFLKEGTDYIDYKRHSTIYHSYYRSGTMAKPEPKSPTQNPQSSKGTTFPTTENPTKHNRVILRQLQNLQK